MTYDELQITNETGFSEFAKDLNLPSNGNGWDIFQKVLIRFLEKKFV